VTTILHFSVAGPAWERYHFVGPLQCS